MEDDTALFWRMILLFFLFILVAVLNRVLLLNSASFLVCTYPSLLYRMMYSMKVKNVGPSFDLKCIACSNVNRVQTPCSV